MLLQDDESRHFVLHCFLFVFSGAAVVLADPDRQGVVFVLWAFAHVYTFLRRRSPTAVLSARADCDSQSQSNLFRPDLFCLSVNILDLESIQLTLARTCAVIVNVPDLKAYSSYAARNSDRSQLLPIS